MTTWTIVLAAGASSRFGAHPKQLARFHGEPLVARAVRVARQAGTWPLVVLGADAERVSGVLDPDVEVVFNESWESGMGSSIAAGALALRARTVTAVIVLPCDLPLVEASDLVALLEALADHDVAASRWGDTVGVPAAFGPGGLPILERLGGDVGARRFLRDGTVRVAEVAVPAAEHDVDSADELNELEQRRSS